jgi:hypothetical protein
VKRWIALSFVVLLAAGCVRPRPNTRAQPAPLDVPAPPPRVIVPPEPEQPADEPVVEEPEANERRPTRRSQPRERPETAKPPEAKQEPPVTEAVRPPVPPPVPLGQLQPVLPASPSEMDRQVSDQLTQAKRDLDRIDYRALSADAKSQYDTAKRFIEQAGQALKDKNLVFAARLAEKALGLASNLVQR